MASRRISLATAIAVALCMVAGPSVAYAAQAEAPSKAHRSAVQVWAAKKYGTFKARTYHGTGSDVISMPSGARAGLVHSDAHGEDNFIVYTINADNTDRELVANGIGEYDATMAFGLDRKNTARRMKVQADGAWTITVRPVRDAGSISGSHVADGVYLYGGGAATVSLRAKGDSNFVIWQYGSPTGAINLVANEIAPWSGKGLLYRGPSVLEVRADSAWAATVRR